MLPQGGLLPDSQSPIGVEDWLRGKDDWGLVERHGNAVQPLLGVTNEMATRCTRRLG